jgi:D-alanine-D-alanine ligase-like ATP-grasp enzyme
MKRVGILRGGTGRNYDSSLRDGAYLIAHIFENMRDKYKPVDLLVDKEGVLHIGGVPMKAEDLPDRVDIIWNTATPELARIFSVPSVGVSHLSTILANNQDALRESVKDIGLKMPRSILLPAYQADFDGPREEYAANKAKEIHNKFGAPWIIKSYTPDTTMGIHLARTYPELVRAIEDGVNHNKSILVEEFIAGKVASLHSMPGFRKEPMYTFPFGASFGQFSSEEKDSLISMAKDLHDMLGAEHYLKSDFILAPHGEMYLLNLDLVPDVKPDSHFSQVVESAGAKMHHIIEHILERAQ